MTEEVTKTESGSTDSNWITSPSLPENNSSVNSNAVKMLPQANEQTQRFLMIIGLVIVGIALTIWSVLFYKRQQQ